MKKVLLISLVILSSTIYAQVASNNALNKFVGTWRWTSGRDTFEITLHKQVHRNMMESIVGWHKYVKNGVLIQSSYQYIGRNINIDSSSINVDFKTTISGSTYATKTTKLVSIRAFDFYKRQNNGGFLELLPNSLTQARWRLTHYSGNSLGPSSSILFRIPRDIILTKL